MKRTRTRTATKVASVTRDGVVTKSNTLSTAARIQQLITALGLDPQDYRERASIRLYSRMAQHQYLGIS
jgi:hypothetical protein